MSVLLFHFVLNILFIIMCHNHVQNHMYICYIVHDKNKKKYKKKNVCTHITTSIKCYLHSLRYVYVPFTNISCQSNSHVYI